MTKEKNAYFTVEAAMIFSLVIFVNVLLIYLGIFQYNRCLMEQDMGFLILKGCAIQDNEKDGVMQKLQYYADKIDKEKYLMWKEESMGIRLEKGTLRIEQCGSLYFPFTGMWEGDSESHWKAKIKYENQRVNPVSVIRKYRKLTGGV